MADFKINVKVLNSIINNVEEIGVAGESLTEGSLCYLNGDNKWYLASSTDAAKCSTELRIAQQAIIIDTAGPLLQYGVKGALGPFTIGEKLYVGETPGAIVSGAPTNPAHYQRYIGTANSVTSLVFNPDSTYIKVDASEVEGISFNFLKDVVDDITPQLGGDLDAQNKSILNVKDLTFQGGEPISHNDKYHTINVPTGDGTIVKVGIDNAFEVHNDTGSTLFAGTVVYPNGASTAEISNVSKALADSHETISLQLGVVASDILNGANGHVYVKGVIDPIDTSLFPTGPVYLSSTIPGALTSVKPEFPEYEILMGIVDSSLSLGVITIDPKYNTNDTIINFWNGTIREKFDFRVTTDGITVTGTLTPASSKLNLTMIFNGAFDTLIATPGIEVQLVPGIDPLPTENYIYVPESTRVLTVSTSDFPTTAHIRIARVALRSVASTVTDGPIKNQNINDAMAEPSGDGRGHMAHIGDRLRLLEAKWQSGAEGITTIDNTITPYDVWLTITGGIIYQLHRQVYPAQDTQSGDEFHVINDFFNPYRAETNLNTLTEDSSGVTLNNTSFSAVVWGVMNKTGETQHIMVNLPTTSYAFSSPDDALNDALNYTDYSIPKLFEGTGFLMARFTFTQKNGVWQLIATQDIRGKSPNTLGGGGGTGGTGVDSFTALTDTPNDYIGSGGYQVKVNLAETGLEFTPAILGDKNFIFDQGVPSNTWNINHPLNKRPSVETVDTADTVVKGQVEYIDDNNLTITFNAIFAGKAYLN